MNGRSDPVARLGRWFTLLRLAAVPLAFVYVALHADEFPDGYETVGWAVSALLLVEAVALFLVLRLALDPATRLRFDLVALAFDLAIVFAFIYLFSYEPGQPLRSVAFLVVVEAALRFGRTGGLAVAAISVPLFFGAEIWRDAEFGFEFQPEAVILRPALMFLIAVVVGQLIADLRREERLAHARAGEAERLGDQLARRVDLLDAANRCARALGSSLELEEAFAAFVRELRGFVPFDRLTVVHADETGTHVLAVAGRGSEAVFPVGSHGAPLDALVRAVVDGRTAYRAEMGEDGPEDERELVVLGLRSQVIAPLTSGARATGVLSFARAEPHSFTDEDVEFIGLLGRVVGTAVQNIRAYEAERGIVEELRRLSTLRADFVSLVSHELRSPMAAVIGAARTLQQRWRELAPHQRESFLALIADETGRLATLIGDVLDTSRIEAGTFSYAFSDVDVGQLARDTAATAALGQDEIEVRATVRDPVPRVRGDSDRLRQVLGNLIDNAVKYSPTGDEVEVRVYAHAGQVLVDVIDGGTGIARDQQRVIFEKFGRARSGSASKPGTGLGLFIARSIAEAHGGSLEVRSAPQRGTTFTLTLPATSDR